MADLDTCLSLTVDSIHTVRRLISPYIHHTPVLTSKTLDRIASTPQERSALKGTLFKDLEPAKPVFRLYFKCENFQKIGAFKARARRGLAAGSRIATVNTLTIADGLRTPVGDINWTVISDQKKVRGVFAVTEDQIKDAMKLVLERMKLVIEPSAAVPLAVVLFEEKFRTIAEKEGGEKGWDVGVIFSGEYYSGDNLQSAW